jgi:hypothetical protein
MIYFLSYVVPREKSWNRTELEIEVRTILVSPSRMFFAIVAT